MTERRVSGNEEVRRKQEAQEALQVSKNAERGEHDEEVSEPAPVRRKSQPG